MAADNDPGQQQQFETLIDELISEILDNTEAGQPAKARPSPPPNLLGSVRSGLTHAGAGASALERLLIAEAVAGVLADAIAPALAEVLAPRIMKVLEPPAGPVAKAPAAGRTTRSGPANPKRSDRPGEWRRRAPSPARRRAHCRSELLSSALMCSS